MKLLIGGCSVHSNGLQLLAAIHKKLDCAQQGPQGGFRRRVHSSCRDNPAPHGGVPPARPAAPGRHQHRLWGLPERRPYEHKLVEEERRGAGIKYCYWASEHHFRILWIFYQKSHTFFDCIYIGNSLSWKMLTQRKDQNQHFKINRIKRMLFVVSINFNVILFIEFGA